MSADIKRPPTRPLPICATIGVGASVAVALTSGMQPTGRGIADVLWLFLFGAVVGAASLRAPRLLIALVGALVVVSASALGMIAAVATSAIGLVGADRHGLLSRPAPNDPALSSALAALAAPTTMLCLVDLADVAGAGSSALIAALVTVMLVGAAVPRPLPRFVGPSTLFLVVATVPVVAVSVHGAHAVKDDIYAARAHGNGAADAFRSGDLARAEVELDSFETATADAVGSLDSWRLLPVKGLPIASQNLDTVERIAASGHEVASAARKTLTVAQASDGLFADGAIAIDQVQAIVAAGDALRIDAEVLGASLTAERGPWIAPPLSSALDTAHARLTPLVAQAEGASALSGLTNSLLGADGPRQYLVLFANPAEARDLGGHTGSTAVLRVDNGAIELIDTRRNGVLNYDSTTAAVLTSTLPARYLEQRPWQFAQNYSGTANLPTVAAALDDIYPAVAGHDIDGVIYIDPIALDALIGLSGPITLDSVGRTFQRGDLATFLLRNQYAEYDPRGEREEVFAELGTAAFEALSTGDIDASAEDLERLSTVIRQGRLSFSPIDHDELAAMDALGVSGAITELRPDADYLAVSHINSAPNKLDAYLHRTIQYDVDISGDSLTSTATITLDNQAPGGLPEFAAGNTNGLPDGTNRMTLVIHTPHELLAWSGADAEPELSRSFREFGRWRHERIVVIPRGDTRTVTIELSGTAPTSRYELDIDAQPLIHADNVDVSVHIGDEKRSAAFVLRHDTTITPG